MPLTSWDSNTDTHVFYFDAYSDRVYQKSITQWAVHSHTLTRNTRLGRRRFSRHPSQYTESLPVQAMKATVEINHSCMYITGVSSQTLHLPPPVTPEISSSIIYSIPGPTPS